MISAGIRSAVVHQKESIKTASSTLYLRDNYQLGFIVKNGITLKLFDLTPIANL